MKKLYILLLTSLMFSCGVINQNKAIEYNNALISEQEAVAEHINDFIELITTADSLNNTIIQEKRSIVLISIDKSIKNVEEIGDYNNSSEFKNSILKVLKAYRNGVENEYTEMANYLLLAPEEQTPDKYFKTQAVAFEADSLISVAESDFMDAQKYFADKHEIKLSPIPTGY